MAVSPRILAGATLAACAAAAYSNSLHVPFVFDDLGAVVGNPTLHSAAAALFPPAGGITVTGRPLLNATLALNYACGGLNPVGYHVANLAIHALASLALFGLVRRTLGSAARAVPIAFAAALLWSLHPLQTEAVTYISQRAESQMALFYLLTLYCFRLACDRGQPGWLAGSVACCLGGMATKEVMASAPLLVLLYDRTFVAGSWAAAWRQRRGYYLALAATWLLLGAEVLAGKSRGGTVGFGLGIAWGHYLFGQCSAIAHYLRLAVWPAPLIFDYGLATEFHPPALALLAAGLVLGLAAAALWAVRRYPTAGFLGIWFFAILAPTSLVPGNRQTWAEHRMYLALAPIAAWAGYGLMRRERSWSWLVLAMAAAACGLATFERNRDYRSNQALWSDTALKRPGNAFAQYNLGEEWLREKAYPAAEAALRRSVALDPGYAEAHNNLGNVFAQTGQAAAARAEFALAARLKPASAEIRNNLGNAFLAEGELDQAEAEYRAAAADDPGFAAPHHGLAQVRLHRNQLDGALAEYERALQLDPAQSAVRDQMGAVLLSLGRREEALRQFAEAVRLAPGDAAARFNYGNALAQQRQFAAALEQYQAALALNPNDPLLHYNCATAFVLAGRTREARREYAEALRLRPDFAQARARLKLLEGPGYQ